MHVVPRFTFGKAQQDGTCLSRLKGRLCRDLPYDSQHELK